MTPGIFNAQNSGREFLNICGALSSNSACWSGSWYRKFTLLAVTVRPQVLASCAVAGSILLGYLRNLGAFTSSIPIFSSATCIFSAVQQIHLHHALKYVTVAELSVRAETSSRLSGMYQNSLDCDSSRSNFLKLLHVS
jgi:hypothetical protein